MFSIQILVLFMQNVKFLHPIFLGKDPDKGKRNGCRPPGQKAFLPYALIIFPFAAMPQKSFKDPAPSLCIPARLPDGAFQAGVCSLTVRPALLKSHDPAVYEHRISDAFLAGAEGLSVCHGLQVSACDGPAGLSESFLDLAGDLQGPLSFRFQARDHTGPDQCPARCLHIAHACAEAGRDLLHLFFLQAGLVRQGRGHSLGTVIFSGVLALHRHFGSFVQIHVCLLFICPDYGPSCTGDQAPGTVFLNITLKRRSYQ